MKLLVSSYNNGGATWNAEAEDTDIVSYQIEHRFNEPAIATIVLRDPSGSVAQKYNVDANDVYIGPGKVTIEDPSTGAPKDIFFGRIIKAEPDTASRIVTLTCEDWLSQLNEEQITYDMREDLDGSGLRQSSIAPDYDNTDGFGIAPANEYWVDFAKWYNNDDTSYTDETTEAQESTADDMTLMNAGMEVNDAYYFGFLAQTTKFKLNLTTSGDGVWTIIWEYWDGDSWESLAGVTDGTEKFEAAAGWHEVSWTLPGDWATVAVDGDTAYWVRARCSAFTNLNTDPLGGQAKVEDWSRVYDKSAILTADAHNDKYFVLTDYMAGSKAWTTGPYTATVTNGSPPTGDGDHEVLWVDDTNTAVVFDAAADFEVQYDYKIYLGHNTATTFYVDDSISTAKVIMTAKFAATAGETCYVKVWENSGGGSWVVIGELDNDNTISSQRYDFTVPEQYLTDLVDSSGLMKVMFDISWAAGANSTLSLTYCVIEVTVDSTGYSTAPQIKDGSTIMLAIDADLAGTSNKIFDGAKYCVGRPIYQHLDSIETPGDFITDGVAGSGPDAMEALTAAATIEHTSGISTRQYINKTRLEILQDLARQDKAEFYIALGTTTVTWKSTWGANDNTITDAIVTSWQAPFDYTKLANEFNIYGMRIGDRQLQSNVTDATSIAKYKATRSRTERSAGLVSEYDTSARGTALLNQHKDIQQMLTATIPGFDSSYRLGIITEVTSADLGITAVDYIVDSWYYDSSAHQTTIRLHPKVSTTGLIRDDIKPLTTAMQDMRRGQTDKYIASPDSDTV
jgi:hypothetical protein